MDSAIGKAADRFFVDQQGGLADQLNCGARSLDLRIGSQHGKIVLHHDKFIATMNFEEEINAIIGWANSHPTELVMLNLNHCMDFDPYDATDTPPVIDCSAPFFTDKVSALGIPIVPNLGGSDCPTGMQMTLGDAKAAAKLPGGGMILAVFDDSHGNIGNCFVQNYDDTLGWKGTCPYLGTANDDYVDWTKLWGYLKGVMGNPGGDMGQIQQALWQEGTSGIHISAGLLTNRNSHINQAVYKQLQKGFLPKEQVRILRMNNVCEWGPEISSFLGANVSDADRQKCYASCKYEKPAPFFACDNAAPACCDRSDSNCCGGCNYVTTAEGNKCVVAGANYAPAGECADCTALIPGSPNSINVNTWVDFGGTPAYCQFGYRC
jgi:hypothetical protein